MLDRSLVTFTWEPTPLSPPPPPQDASTHAQHTMAARSHIPVMKTPPRYAAIFSHLCGDASRIAVGANPKRFAHRQSICDLRHGPRLREVILVVRWQPQTPCPPA
jgi:hypothetical protein